MMFDEQQQGLGAQGRGQHHGKYPGTVKDNAPADAEVPGSILVQVAFFQERDPGNPAAVRPMECIARPCLPPGVFFVPAVDAAVWVEFVAGDLTHPIWTGAWYPEEAAPATPEGEQPTADQRLLRSVAGHVLCLDDTAGSERVVLQDPNEHALTMNKDGVELKCGASVSLLLKSDAIVLACGSSKITLDNQGIRLEAGGHHFTMEAGGTTLNGQLVVLKPLIDWLMSHSHPPNAPAGQAPQLVAPIYVSQLPG
jgi:hypothetical protein